MAGPKLQGSTPPAQADVETGILLPNNQRQHRTSQAPKDVVPSRICADYCAPCQALVPIYDVETGDVKATFNCACMKNCACTVPYQPETRNPEP